MDKELKEKFISPGYIYAIVGATQNAAKYGYKVLVDLKDKGFNVIPVNPKYDEVAGLKCYPDLLSLDDRPDVVVLVLGKENAAKIVKQCIELDLNRLWFQPGSEFEEAVNLANQAGLEIMVGECLMRETD